MPDDDEQSARSPARRLEDSLYEATGHRLTRRRLVTAALVAGAAGALVAIRPDTQGGPHDDYFKSLSAALRQAGIGRPTLLIDKQRLDRNIDTLLGHLPAGMGYRIVAKSLPSLDLIRYIMARTQTRRLMVFHQPFLNLIAREIPTADILLGKPMPVAAAARFYDNFAGGDFAPETQIQWLIDSLDRLAQYRQMAEQKNVDLQINLEIDVGLHRGGLTSVDQLKPIFAMILASDRLRFTGFMGYEPHLASMPGFLGLQEAAIQESHDTYRAFITAAREQWGNEDWTLNAAGSPTYRLYTDTSLANEVSAGSALVKPAHFDTQSLADYVPAAFIATPVIKALAPTELPGLPFVSRLMRAWDPNTRRAFFIYGGKWMAEPVSPPGLQLNGIFGRSSNQELWTGSRRIDLKPDDYVFFRPEQSEFVFLQFGDIAVYDSGQITGSWPVFTQGA